LEWNSTEKKILRSNVMTAEKQVEEEKSRRNEVDAVWQKAIEEEDGGWLNEIEQSEKKKSSADTFETGLCVGAEKNEKKKREEGKHYCNWAKLHLRGESQLGQ
jgi:hypothetical protein